MGSCASRSRFRAAIALLIFTTIAVAPLSCTRKPDANASRELPKLPPPPEASAPADLSIAVDVDGVPSAAIDHARLDATKPDFADGERRAWKLETLLGPSAARDGATFTITGEKGVALVLHRATRPGDPVPVLVLSRRGDLLAAMVEPSDPFPAYHGHGGSRERRGDPLPRVAGVTRIALGRGPTDADAAR